MQLILIAGGLLVASLLSARMVDCFESSSALWFWFIMMAFVSGAGAIVAAIYLFEKHL